MDPGNISIHSPYTGRDERERILPRPSRDFNPLSLYRERHYYLRYYENRNVFQSTLPIQGETKFSQFFHWSHPFQSTLPIQGETTLKGWIYFTRSISIHSPYTGRDNVRRWNICVWEGHFNPLSLYRERRCVPLKQLYQTVYFNPLSLYRERQTNTIMYVDSQNNFNPLSLYRERHFIRLREHFKVFYFNPLSLYRERQW